MKQIIILLFFLSFHFTGKSQCVIDPGKVDTIHNNSGYQFFLSKQPKYTCYPRPDSFYVELGIFCYKTNHTEIITMNSHDTITLDIKGKVIIGSHIKWVFGNKTTRTDFNPICFNGSMIDCYEIVPELSTENPPTIPIVINVDNGYVNSNVSGNLVVLSYPDFTPQYVFSYNSSFSYLIPNGTYYIYIILPDWSIYDLGVIIN